MREEEEELTHLNASTVGDVFRERLIAVEIVRGGGEEGRGGGGTHSP